MGGENPTIAIVRGLKVRVTVLDRFLAANGVDKTYGFASLHLASYICNLEPGGVESQEPGISLSPMSGVGRHAGVLCHHTCQTADDCASVQMSSAHRVAQVWLNRGAYKSSIDGSLYNQPVRT